MSVAGHGRRRGGGRRALRARAPAGTRGRGHAPRGRPVPPLRAERARRGRGPAARAGGDRGGARPGGRQRGLVPRRDGHERPGGRLPRRGRRARDVRHTRRGRGRRVRAARDGQGCRGPARGDRALGLRQRQRLLRLAHRRLPHGAGRAPGGAAARALPARGRGDPRHLARVRAPRHRQQRHRRGRPRGAGGPLSGRDRRAPRARRAPSTRSRCSACWPPRSRA